MAEPIVSVIVSAYNRRQYLPEALHSLEGQTLDKGKFEVIVVKNFEDPMSDEIIRRNGWRWVYSEEVFWGRFLAAGLEETRGDVITFLDDDDMYVPERLTVVSKEFSADSNLCYYHNAASIVYEDGSKGRITGALSLRGRANELKFSQLVSPMLDFNLSSIAVRGHVARDRVEVLKRIKKSLDTAAFAIASSSNCVIKATAEALTLYRVHSGSTSPIGLFAASGSLDDWGRRFASVWKTYVEDYEALAEATKGLIRDVLRWKAATVRLGLGLFRGVGGSTPRARDYLTLLEGMIKGARPPRTSLAGALTWFLPLGLRRPLIEAKRRSMSSVASPLAGSRP